MATAQDASIAEEGEGKVNGSAGERRSPEEVENKGGLPDILRHDEEHGIEDDDSANDQSESFDPSRNVVKKETTGAFALTFHNADEGK